MFVSTVLSLLASSALALGAPVTKRADVCNGRAELCGRKYSEVTFMGSHNSYAISSNPLALSRNQKVSLIDQFNRGIRMFQGQGHAKDGTVHLCHSSCSLFDGGSAEDYLRELKGFLDANPNEVLTIIFTNPEGLPIQDWDPAFKNSGIADMAFVPPALPVARADWPTMSELIDTGKRVVVFMDANTDTAAVPYILPQFDMIWETPFSVTDANFPCSVDRITGDLSPEDHMYMINHSLNTAIPIPFADDIIVPDLFSAAETNSIASITKDSDGCKAIPESGGRVPNFVLLDWVDEGEVPQAGDVLNGF